MAADWPERIEWILERYEDGSRRAMGRKIGLSGQAISAWTRGEARPSGEGLASIIETYPDVDARWLLSGEGSPHASGARGFGSVDDPPAGDDPPGDDGPPGEADASIPDSPDAAYRAGRRAALEELLELLERLLREGAEEGAS